MSEFFITGSELQDTRDAWGLAPDGAMPVDDDALLDGAMLDRAICEDAMSLAPEDAALVVELLTDTSEPPPTRETRETPLPLPEPSHQELARRAHGGSVSPAGRLKLSPYWCRNAEKRWALNAVKASNYFKKVTHKQVRCRLCNKTGKESKQEMKKKGAVKSLYHCSHCSLVENKSIRCLKHLVAICLGCRAAHANSCNPFASKGYIKTCLEAGLHKSNSCKICKEQMR